MKKTDFSTGPVWRAIVAQAVPLTIAQIVHLLYNVVDRIFLGHMGAGNHLALTGVGLAFPVITLIMAFTALFGMGGVPLFSIERGAKNDEKAGRILGNSFALLLISAGILMLLGYLFLKPVLFAFGASAESYPYAARYLRIYLLGTPFSMIATGMNGYINAQGFPRIGMLSVVIGAAVNIILDPLLIFRAGMGVTGAALATILSQMLSAAWVLAFLTGKKISLPLKRSHIRVERSIAGAITRLGLSSFVVQGTNFAVQVACNRMLSIYGGDLYVGVMTVANSVREIFNLPVQGITSGSQPVISYNYGAGAADRVKAGIRFNTFLGSAYTLLAWLAIVAVPAFWFGIFSDEPQMTAAGIPMLKIYFFGFVFMALQFSGQTVFQAVGDAKHAIFFSLLRKIVIVVPLTLLLPRMGLGTEGVFLAEPISNVIGGTACFVTMWRTVYRRM